MGHDKRMGQFHDDQAKPHIRLSIPACLRDDVDFDLDKMGWGLKKHRRWTTVRLFCERGNQALANELPLLRNK